MDTLAIIKRIELRIAELGMSKADFYKKSGISSASYSHWNTGKYKPTDGKLRSAAEVLGVSFEYLRYGKQEKHYVELFSGAGGPPILFSSGSNAENMTSTDKRMLRTAKNIIKIAGRDGSFIERPLTDEQVELLKAMLNQLPEISDDL